MKTLKKEYINEETIRVVGFAGIRDATFNIKAFTVIIGEQAVGKSMVAKLLHFFKGYLPSFRIAIESGQTKKTFVCNFLNSFKESFPENYWPKNDFFIEYRYSTEFLKISGSNKKKLDLECSDFFSSEYSRLRMAYRRLVSVGKSEDGLPSARDNWEQMMEITSRLRADAISALGPYGYSNQYFIPAGRSFFANLERNIFSFLSSNNQLDPHVKMFGSFYEQIKSTYGRSFGRASIPTKSRDWLDRLIFEITRGTYKREKNEDWITTLDGRTIPVSLSSSGQQEALPLCLILRRMAIMGTSNCHTLYIEEPEAHLFPRAQKRMIDLISGVSGIRKRSTQIMITTHSPYVLTAFNNLLLAGKIIEDSSGKSTDSVAKIMFPECAIKPHEFAAYSMCEDQVRPMLSDESGLIDAGLIDDVSQDLAEEFDRLLLIEQ